MNNQDQKSKSTNPMAGSWKPEDKAIESAFEKPEEFDLRHPLTGDSIAPVPSGKPKTVGEMETQAARPFRAGNSTRPR